MRCTARTTGVGGFGCAARSSQNGIGAATRGDGTWEASNRRAVVFAKGVKLVLHAMRQPGPDSRLGLSGEDVHPSSTGMRRSRPA